jgi:hypothetical protein
LLNWEELAEKESIIKDRYDKIIEIENKIQWNVTFTGNMEEYEAEEE